MGKTSAVVKEKKKEDIRKKFNIFLDKLFKKMEEGKKFSPEFLKEMETLGARERSKRKMKPIKIIKSRVLTKPAITQALNLASDIELAARKEAELDTKKWVTEGK
jgi:uncharacterized protein (DUF1919 family)